MIYVIIPVHGGYEVTGILIDCLSSGFNADEIKYIVVDDGPVNEEHLYSFADNFCYQHFEQDLWWVGGVNVGLEILKSYSCSDNDVVVLANNDVVIDPSEFRKLIHFYRSLENNDCLVHPRTVDSGGSEVSSGAAVISWFPYVTRHPMGQFLNKLERVDLGTARMLITKFSIIDLVDKINPNLVQYHGDNYLTLKLFKDYNIPTYIVSDFVCVVDNGGTGLKNSNINTFSGLLSSFFVIRSSNNIKYRYYFVRSFFSFFESVFIVASMSFNSFVRFLFNWVRGVF